MSTRQFDMLAVATLAAILAHMAHLPLWLNASLFILMSVRWTQRRWRTHWGSAPMWLRLPLTLALPVAVIAQYGNLFGREPGSALAVGLLVLKLGESEWPRDARAGVTFACFVLMAALLFSPDLLTSALIGLGLVPQLLTLRALEPKPLDATRHPIALADELRMGIPSTLLTLLAAAPLAMATFVFLPRLGQPLWGAPAPDNGKTGLSDRMTPGSMTELLTDDSAAFRVTFDGEPPAPLQRYWRGLVLDRFDGRTWSGGPPTPLDPDAPGFEARGPALEYEMTMEPTQQRWLVALDLPLGAPQGFVRTGEFSLLGEKPVSEVTRYRLSSVLDYRLTGLGPTTQRATLSLPATFNPRARALAQRWRQQLGDDARIVRAAMQLFNESFTYTLLAPPLGRDSMDDFLFDTRAGFCEHFSSAFVVLMRAAGIPARVVVGYQGGYWNGLGQYLVVRQSDAHAWAEIWRDGEGWMRVDPTAAVSPLRVQLGGRAASAGESPWFAAPWLLQMRNRWDLVNHLWNKAIVQFNTLQQQGLLTRFGIKKADWSQLAIAFGLCCTVLLGIGLLWAMRRDAQSGDLLDRSYRRLCRKLARAGSPRQPPEGPLHYLQRLRTDPARTSAQLESLVGHYMLLRYAQATPDPVSLAGFVRGVRRFRATPASKAGTPHLSGA